MLKKPLDPLYDKNANINKINAICENMEFFGLKLDQIINNQTDAIETEINSTDSKTRIVVIKTDEMGEIAKETANLV